MAPGGRRGHSQARRRCQEASAGRRARGGLIGAGAATSILTADANKGPTPWTARALLHVMYAPSGDAASAGVNIIITTLQKKVQKVRRSAKTRDKDKKHISL